MTKQKGGENTTFVYENEFNDIIHWCSRLEGERYGHRLTNKRSTIRQEKKED